MIASSSHVLPAPHSPRTRITQFRAFTKMSLTFRFAVPERLDEHPNNQRPPLIDSEVLHAMNTSGALVADADPVSRIFSLAQRCSLRDRAAVIISNKNVFNRPSDSLSPFHVLPFHISGSSFTILPKLPAHASGPINSILMPSQNDVRRLLNSSKRSCNFRIKPFDFLNHFRSCTYSFVYRAAVVLLRHVIPHLGYRLAPPCSLFPP
jgi:hypothetical protein